MVFQKYISEKSEIHYWYIRHNMIEISEKILKFQQCVPSQSPTNHPICCHLVYHCLCTEKKISQFKWNFDKTLPIISIRLNAAEPYSHAIISIFSATFCLAQLKLVNIWLKRILGSLTVHFDPVLANKIFWQAKCIFEICIIRLRCESDEFLYSITDTYSYEDILKIYLAYQKYFVGQNFYKLCKTKCGGKNGN